MITRRHPKRARRRRNPSLVAVAAVQRARGRCSPAAVFIAAPFIRCTLFGARAPPSRQRLRSPTAGRRPRFVRARARRQQTVSGQRSARSLARAPARVSIPPILDC